MGKLLVFILNHRHLPAAKVLMICSLPHSPFCSLLLSPMCMLHLFICTYLNSPPNPMLAHHHLCYIKTFVCVSKVCCFIFYFCLSYWPFSITNCFCAFSCSLSHFFLFFYCTVIWFYLKISNLACSSQSSITCKLDA